MQSFLSLNKFSDYPIPFLGFFRVGGWRRGDGEVRYVEGKGVWIGARVAMVRLFRRSDLRWESELYGEIRASRLVAAAAVAVLPVPALISGLLFDAVCKQPYERNGRLVLLIDRLSANVRPVPIRLQLRVKAALMQPAMV